MVCKRHQNQMLQLGREQASDRRQGARVRRRTGWVLSGEVAEVGLKVFDRERLDQLGRLG